MAWKLSEKEFVHWRAKRTHVADAARDAERAKVNKEAKAARAARAAAQASVKGNSLLLRQRQLSMEAEMRSEKTGRALAEAEARQAAAAAAAAAESSRARAEESRLLRFATDQAERQAAEAKAAADLEAARRDAKAQSAWATEQLEAERRRIAIQIVCGRLVVVAIRVSPDAGGPREACFTLHAVPKSAAVSHGSCPWDTAAVEASGGCQFDAEYLVSVGGTRFMDAAYVAATDAEVLAVDPDMDVEESAVDEPAPAPKDGAKDGAEGTAHLADGNTDTDASCEPSEAVAIEQDAIETTKFDVVEIIVPEQTAKSAEQDLVVEEATNSEALETVMPEPIPSPMPPEQVSFFIENPGFGYDVDVDGVEPQEEGVDDDNVDMNTHSSFDLQALLARLPAPLAPTGEGPETPPPCEDVGDAEDMYTLPTLAHNANDDGAVNVNSMEDKLRKKKGGSLRSLSRRTSVSSIVSVVSASLKDAVSPKKRRRRWGCLCVPKTQD